MIGFVFENKNSLVRTSDLEKTKRKLSAELSKIREGVSKKEAGYDAINAPFNSKEIESILELAKQKQMLNADAMILVGIGGSNLGAMAVYEALAETIDRKRRLYFADTTDSDEIYSLKILIEQILKSEKNVILNLVSKSGSTTESIANFQVLLDVVAHYRKDYQKYVVVTTDKNSKLEQAAIRGKFDILHIPSTTGGRYSVFTAAGLFPLAFAGIDIKKLARGARQITEKCLSKELSKNPSAQCAIDMYCNKNEGKSIHDVFFFCTKYESVGKWYRQLLAESLGKKYSRSGALVREGITPTVSIGSTDLHSMAQLYLGGPEDKFSTLFKINPRQKVRVPKMKEYDFLVAGIQDKKLSDIMDAIFSGVKVAYIKGKRPFNQITLDKNEFAMGQYMQYEMIKVIMLGALMNVNQFDQPSVEEYKEETRKILGK